ncbi:hypothetical protein PDE_07751 [Penicillium oxalicum 114-2]|uniref:Uncharacterized protein n=1 Tax=Penicillium oxalicum (strain 114-2 / CGMCC 5302) TaxID=933388 RepID=S7ZVM0_PENO1|nr:hypothetical protein PDE_07751 [Penicillium oxalicum 114-2]
MYYLIKHQAVTSGDTGRKDDSV